jgi:hypothetical protein
MQNKFRRTFNHDFPFTELASIGSQLFILVSCVIQYFKKNEMLYLIIALVSFFAALMFIWITNWRNKKLYFKDDSLLVKPYLNKTKVIFFNDIKGYLLKETYSRFGTGLDYHIHIILNNGRNINLIKEVYPEYDRIRNTLNKLGIKYLGSTQIKWKFKTTYARLTVYSTALVMILFLFLQLLKSFK